MLWSTNFEPQFGEMLSKKKKAIPFFSLVELYRAYTKEWCGFNVYYMNTAPFDCVCPVFQTIVVYLLLLLLILLLSLRYILFNTFVKTCFFPCYLSRPNYINILEFASWPAEPKIFTI
jgi:hypothetical protein